MKKNGFSLIEVIIVTVIIGLLASIAIPRYMRVVRKADWVDATAVLDVVYKAVRYYHDVNNVWPPDGGTGTYWDWTNTNCAGINAYLIAIGSGAQVPAKACAKFNYDLYWMWQDQCDIPDNPWCSIMAWRKGTAQTDTSWGIRKRIDTGAFETNANPGYYP